MFSSILFLQAYFSLWVTNENLLEKCFPISLRMGTDDFYLILENKNHSQGGREGGGRDGGMEGGGREGTRAKPGNQLVTDEDRK